MVARPGEYRANCNGGELSPEMHGRTDVQQFYAGMAEMTNVEPVAQGGFRLLPRTRKLSRIRRAIENIAAASETNNSGVFAAPGTVFLVSFTEPGPLSIVAVENFLVANATAAVLQPGLVAITGNFGTSARTLRQRIEPEQLLSTGNNVIVTFAAPAENEMVITAAYIGHAAGAGNPYDFEAAPVQLKFGGNNNVTVAANASENSDAADIQIQAGKALLISFVLDQTSGTGHLLRSLTSPGFAVYEKGGSDAAAVTPSGFALHSQRVYAISQVSVTADTISQALQVEYLDAGAVWQPLAGAMRLTTTERNRMAARPPGDQVTASAVRVRLAITPIIPLTITIGSVKAKKEVAGWTPVRVRPFTFDDQQTYTFVFTALHADIFRDGEFVGATETRLAADMVDTLDERQRFDAMLAFHQNMEPIQVFRDASDDEWPWQQPPFTNLPQVDYGEDYEHTIDEWMVYLRQSGLSNLGGVVVTFTVNGEESQGVQITGADNTARANNFAAAVEAALEAMAGVSAGVTVTVDGTWADANGRIKIAFTGDGNAGNVFTIAAQVVSHTEAAATVGHTVIGELGGEDVMSGLRGWPACAQFYQDRLVTAGFKAKKSALLASVNADYFNLNTKIIAASGAILLNLDTDGAERILRLARSKHLLIFTSDAEYYVSDRTLARGTVPNIVECSRNGVSPLVPVVASGGDEGAVYYVSADKNDPARHGIMAYAAKYSDTSQSYDSEPMSLLASHLVAGIVDAAIQRATEATAAARYLLPRSDGAMAVGVLIRNQEISGFVRWKTDGQVLASCVDGANVPHLVIERTVDGEPVRFLERQEPGLVFDCVTKIELSEPAATVTGLADYEGAEVWARADGYVVGPFTVEDAEIDLGFEAALVEVGRWTPPVARTLPVPRQVAERVVLERPVRVHTVRADLIGTTSIAIGANDEAPEDVALYRSGDTVDAPPAPYTGPIEVTGLVGWTEKGQVEITQLRPGQLQVRNFTIEARV